MRQFAGHLSIENTSSRVQDRILQFLQITNKRTVLRWIPASLNNQPNIVFIDVSSSPSVYLDAPTHAFRVFVGEFDRNSQTIARACHFRLERDFTLMQFIDLLDRATAKILDRPLSQAADAPPLDADYRLSQWVMLTAPFNDVRYYKAMGLMATQAMTAQQISAATTLGAPEVAALLGELKKRQVLQTGTRAATTPTPDGPATATSKAQENAPVSGLLDKLKRWVSSGRTKHPSFGPTSSTLTR